MRTRAAACAARASAAPAPAICPTRRAAPTAGRARFAASAAGAGDAAAGESVTARSRSPARVRRESTAASPAAAPKAKRVSTATRASGEQAGTASPAPALLQRLCQALLTGYINSTPTAATVLHALYKQGGTQVHIDHMAFRSFGLDGLGIDAASRVWLDLGYTRRDDFTFPTKKLRACWLAPPKPPPGGEDAPLPRIFVSEVDVGALSKKAQGIIARATARAGPLGRHAAMAATVHEAPWPSPPFADYETLAKESEYAAWVRFGLRSGYRMAACAC